MVPPLNNRLNIAPYKERRGKEPPRLVCGGNIGHDNIRGILSVPFRMGRYHSTISPYLAMCRYYKKSYARAYGPIV